MVRGALVAVALACAGCYGSDGRPASDAGLDGWPRPDVALGPGCGVVPLDVLCTDAPIVAGVPTTVDVELGLASGCWCGQSLSCDAEIVGDHWLALTTGLCPALPACDACESPPRGECRLPALDAGTWLVFLHGELGGLVEVVPPGTGGGRSCSRRIVPDPCGVAFPGAFVDVAEACHPSAVGVGAQARIEVVEACGGCAVGPCDVTVTGDVIEVRPSRLPLACPEVLFCRAGCPRTEHVCITPALDAGRHEVRIVGHTTTTSTIEVGPGLSGPETCVVP